MLIRKEYSDTGGLLGIWKMEESREALLHLFPENLWPEVMAYINGVRSDRRAIEWLSTRIMLLELLGKEQIIHNREDGSPFLENGKPYISISHTRDYAAILLHDSCPVGIDIEIRSERVKKIASLIEIEADPEIQKTYPEIRTTIVEITDTDGQIFASRVDYAKGDPLNPMSDEDLMDKFRDVTQTVLTAGRQKKVMDWIMDEGTLTNPIQELTDMLLW